MPLLVHGYIQNPEPWSTQNGMGFGGACGCGACVKLWRRQKAQKGAYQVDYENRRDLLAHTPVRDAGAA